MSRIYFFPKSDTKLNPFANPYTFNFEKSLLKKHTIVNRSTNKNGILEFFKYLFSSDIFLFNWIENTTRYRNAKIKVIIFFLFLLLAKILKKKIVWILHNKRPHDFKINHLTNFMYWLLMKYSDLIITHSLSGIDFAKSNYSKYSIKVKYLIHPVQEIIPAIADLQKKYDILIWGDIHPYKGIVEFLKYLKDSNKSEIFKILIVGKCADDEYKKNLNQYLSEYIIHLDDSYELGDISRLANQASYILFTYKSESVLSSGSLMDSIRMGSNIIGPNIGAFKDISSYGFIRTYNNYDEIIKILRDKKYDMKSNHLKIQNFCFENNWDTFIGKFNKELNRICQ
ncbi:glycosyltransferase [Aquipluma nitroreducens]|uniref:Glycosyltransferase n=1 Tax=Aquipluma nitroreducens TaxID=2010828 RepID=A0A5K7SGH9_9BACT|nr:glycosyltransferase [Aquipluma nitroreducens]BBE20579.1 glycosyltransferase [Aquipluma nitroreducens]